MNVASAYQHVVVTGNGGQERIITGEADFRLTVVEDRTTLVLRITGEFDLAAVGRVEAAVDRRPASIRHLIFDLREVSFIDLAGLMTVIRADERSQAASFDVQVVPPRGLASRVFTLTRAGSQLKMVAGVPRH